MAKLKYRVEEAERVRYQIRDLESQLKGIGAFATLPQSLSDVLRTVATLFPNRIELIHAIESNRLEEEFDQSFSTFALALSEGKQTKKDAKLMALRKLQHNGQEFDMTPHVKYGNRKPKMLRLHYAVKREAKKLIVEHFGDHLDNYTTKTM